MSEEPRLTDDSSRYTGDTVREHANPTRRRYLTGIVAGFGLLAGCLSSGNSSEPEIPVRLRTSEQFDEVASARDPELHVDESGDTDKLTIEYAVEVTDDECVNGEIDVVFRDEEGAIVDELSVRESFEPEETYRVDHAAAVETAAVDEIVVTVGHDPLSARCFL